jgi:hypothetical protein
LLFATAVLSGACALTLLIAPRWLPRQALLALTVLGTVGLVVRVGARRPDELPLTVIARDAV